MQVDYMRGYEIQNPTSLKQNDTSRQKNLENEMFLKQLCSTRGRHNF